MWYNPLIAWLLRSPLHGFLSGSTLLLSYTGRKSGRLYRVPVNYARRGEQLLVTSQRDRNWWRNFIPEGPATIYLQGQPADVNAQAITDPEAVAEELGQYLAARPAWARYFDVTLDPQGQPQTADLEHAAENRVVVRLTLR